MAKRVPIDSPEDVEKITTGYEDLGLVPSCGCCAKSMEAGDAYCPFLVWNDAFGVRLSIPICLPCVELMERSQVVEALVATNCDHIGAVAFNRWIRETRLSALGTVH